LRFKLDENLPLQLKRLFTESGHDAVTVLDQGMGGTADSDVAFACRNEERVLLTQDTDFADSNTPPKLHQPLELSQAERVRACLGLDSNLRGRPRNKRSSEQRRPGLRFFTLSEGRGRFGRLRPKSVRGLPGNHPRIRQRSPGGEGWD